MASASEKSGELTASAEAKQECWGPNHRCAWNANPVTTAEAPKLGRVGLREKRSLQTATILPYPTKLIEKDMILNITMLKKIATRNTTKRSTEIDPKVLQLIEKISKKYHKVWQDLAKL